MICVMRSRLALAFRRPSEGCLWAQRDCHQSQHKFVAECENARGPQVSLNCDSHTGRQPRSRKLRLLWVAVCSSHTAMQPRRLHSKLPGARAVPPPLSRGSKLRGRAARPAAVRCSVEHHAQPVTLSVGGEFGWLALHCYHGGLLPLLRRVSHSASALVAWFHAHVVVSQCFHTFVEDLVFHPVVVFAVSCALAVSCDPWPRESVTASGQMPPVLQDSA